MCEQVIRKQCDKYNNWGVTDAGVIGFEMAVEGWPDKISSTQWWQLRVSQMDKSFLGESEGKSHVQWHRGKKEHGMSQQLQIYRGV